MSSTDRATDDFPQSAPCRDGPTTVIYALGLYVGAGSFGGPAAAAAAITATFERYLVGAD